MNLPQNLRALIPDNDPGRSLALSEYQHRLTAARNSIEAAVEVVGTDTLDDLGAIVLPLQRSRLGRESLTQVASIVSAAAELQKYHDSHASAFAEVAQAIRAARSKTADVSFDAAARTVELHLSRYEGVVRGGQSADGAARLLDRDHRRRELGQSNVRGIPT